MVSPGAVRLPAPDSNATGEHDAYETLWQLCLQQARLTNAFNETSTSTMSNVIVQICADISPVDSVGILYQAGAMRATTNIGPVLKLKRTFP